MKKLLLLLVLSAVVKLCAAQQLLAYNSTVTRDVYSSVTTDTTGIVSEFNDNVSAPVFAPPMKRSCFIRIRPLCINEHVKLAPPLRVLITIPAR